MTDPVLAARNAVLTTQSVVGGAPVLQQVAAAGIVVMGSRPTGTAARCASANCRGVTRPVSTVAHASLPTSAGVHRLTPEVDVRHGEVREISEDDHKSQLPYQQQCEPFFCFFAMHVRALAIAKEKEALVN